MLQRSRTATLPCLPVNVWGLSVICAVGSNAFLVAGFSSGHPYGHILVLRSCCEEALLHNRGAACLQTQPVPAEQQHSPSNCTKQGHQPTMSTGAPAGLLCCQHSTQGREAAPAYLPQHTSKCLSPTLVELAVPVDMPSLRCNTHQRPKLAVPDEMLRLCYESHIRGEYSTSIALLLRVTVAFLIDLTELAERPRLRCTRHQRLGPWHWGLGLLFC